MNRKYQNLAFSIRNHRFLLGFHWGISQSKFFILPIPLTWAFLNHLISSNQISKTITTKCKGGSKNQNREKKTLPSKSSCSLKNQFHSETPQNLRKYPPNLIWTYDHWKTKKEFQFGQSPLEKKTTHPLERKTKIPL